MYVERDGQPAAVWAEGLALSHHCAPNPEVLVPASAPVLLRHHRTTAMALGTPKNTSFAACLAQWYAILVHNEQRLARLARPGWQGLRGGLHRSDGLHHHPEAEQGHGYVVPHDEPAHIHRLPVCH